MPAFRAKGGLELIIFWFLGQYRNHYTKLASKEIWTVAAFLKEVKVAENAGTQVKVMLLHWVTFEKHVP